VNLWQEAFARAVDALAPRDSAEITRFWNLFITGRAAGEGAWFWLQSFRRLYILHLLVLSGSQVEALMRLGRGLYTGLEGCAGLGGAARTRACCLRLGLSALVLAFAAATGWSAPITRAALLGVGGLWLLRWGPLSLAALVFVLQWSLFAFQREELGFYLSWIAYLVVLLMQELRCSRAGSTLLVSSLLYGILEVWHFENPFQIRAFCVCLAANLIFGVLFERVLMPLAAFYIMAALLGALSFVTLASMPLEAGGDFLALWSVPSTKALLVVLKWLMYT